MHDDDVPGKIRVLDAVPVREVKRKTKATQKNSEPDPYKVSDGVGSILEELGGFVKKVTKIVKNSF